MYVRVCMRARTRIMRMRVVAIVRWLLIAGNTWSRKEGRDGVRSTETKANKNKNKKKESRKKEDEISRMNKKKKGLNKTNERENEMERNLKKKDKL